MTSSVWHGDESSLFKPVSSEPDLIQAEPQAVLYILATVVIDPANVDRAPRNPGCLCQSHHPHSWMALILIHPFRDGNGRLSRLLADVMMAQAGYSPLDYSSWDQDRTGYFAAIGQGLDMNYTPMQEWVARAMGDA